MISTKSSIMKKFILKVNQGDLLPDESGRPNKKFHQLMSLRRRYRSAEIIDIRISNIRRISPKNFGPRMFQLLQHWPELEELTIDNGLIDDLVPQVNLKKLKKLAVNGDWSSFQLIRAPALTELDAQYCWSDRYLGSFESFLKASPKLESLKVFMFDLFERMQPGFPFRLKKLVCWSRLFNYHDLRENARIFLLSQAATVETLVAFHDDSEFHEIVLTTFKRLQFLKSDLEKLIASEEFYRNLKPFPVMKEIICIEGFSSKTALQAVLGNCPKLVRLQADNCQYLSNNLEFIAEHNRNLEHLGIRTIKAPIAKFSHLRALSVREVEDADRLIAFLKTNPTIETLCIQELREGIFSSNALDVLINESGLKYVEIDGFYAALLKIFDKIKSGFGTWKTLKMGLSYFFKFPENPADWKPFDKLWQNSRVCR